MSTLRVTVGNDVVDLTAPRTARRHLDERFVSRVFSAAERVGLERAHDPSLALWLGWAAKEAAYKVISKHLGEPPPFAHRRFEVSWSGTSLEAPTPAPLTGVEGVVHYDHLAVPVRVARVNSNYVHIVALLSDGEDPADVFQRLAHGTRATVEAIDLPGTPWAASLEVLQSRLSAAERSAVHSRPSAAVRIGARGDAARLLEVEEGRLEIVCDPGPTGRRPPRLLVDGTPASIDVSLSHDGPWIAWALSTA